MSFKNLGDELKNIKELKDLFANGETLKSVKKNNPEQYQKLLSSANGKSLDDYLETLNEFNLSNKDKKKILKQARKSGNLDVSKKDIKKSLKQNDFSKVSSEAQATEKALSNLGQTSLDNVNSSASKLGETFKTGVTNGVEKAKSGIKSLGSSIKSVLSGLSATLKSYLPLLAAFAAFEGIKAIHSNIQSQRKDELNAGQKNLDKYNKKIDKNNDKVKQAKKLQEEFNTLSSGVNANTNENIGLSTSQYERYLAIKKELVKLNGDLVTGYNSEGEALINNNTAIQDTIDKYQKLADQSKKDIASKKNVSIQNDSMALKAQKSLYGSTFADESLGTNLKRSLPYTFRSAKNLAKDGLSMNEAFVRQSLYSNADFQKQAAKILGKDKIDVSKLTSKQIQELANNSDTFNSEGFIGKNDTKNLKKLLAASKTNYDQLQKYSDSFRKNTLSNISQAVDGYDKLDQTTKTFASNFISNMDIDPSKMLDTDYLDKQEKTVENLTKKLTQNKDVQDQIKNFQKTQVNGKMNANKWQQNVNDQFTALQKSTGIDKDTLALTLGVKLDDKDNVLSSTGKDIAKMQEALNDTFKNQDISKFTDSLNLNDLSNAFDIVTDKTNIFTGSVDQLKERLKMLNNSAASASYTVEGYKAALDTDDDDSAYNTLVSGMKQTKEEYDQGKVGTDQFKTFAGMMSPTGKTDAKNFKENYDNLKKYFTEDNSGVYTFFDDLKAKTNDSGKALADFDKKTQKWKINIDSTASAAKKMGMGLVPFESMLDNLKTYGWKVDYSSLTEQWDDASTKLNEWSQIWEKNGGSLGDSQGKEIENYKQKLEEFRKEGEKLPDNWEKTLTIKVNAAEATTKLTNAVDDYKQKLKDNGDSWAKSSEAKKARQEIFDDGSSATTKAEKAQKATLKEDGLKTNQKYKTERDKANKKVQNALTKAKESGSAKDMDAYQKTVQDRNDLIGKGATDEKYYVKTQFKNRNEVNKELKRNGATVDKDGNVTAGKDNKKDIQTIIDSYNKNHKGSEIKVTWADGKAPKKDEKSESSTKKTKDDSSTKSEKPKKQEKPESSEKGNKSPSLLDKFNNWIKGSQTKETKGDYKKPAEGSGKKTGDTDKKYESVKSWFKSIPSNLNGLFKNAQTKQPSVSYQKPKVQGTQSWQTDNTKYNKAVSSAKKFGGDVVSGAKNIGSSALSGAKSILGSIGSGIKGLFGGSKSSASASQNASKKQSSKSDVKVNVKGNAKKTIDSIKKSLSSMKSKSISIKVKGNAKKTISSISKSLKKLKSKSVSIKAKGNASSVIKKIASALKKLKNKNITVKVKDSASSKISSIKGKLNALGKMHPTPKVTINTSGLHDVEAAKSAINGLHDKSVNVSVNYSQSGSKPSKAYGTFARGSMAWSTAYAKGTANALAGGNIGAKTSGKTLVGELGVEAIIPKNSQRMFLLGTTGPEFADIHSGDIVFNHQQTADLLANGHTSTRAKVQGGMSAFAHGTSFKALSSGQSATASGGWRGGIAEKSGSSSTKKHTESTKKNTEATKKNTDSKKKDSKATDKSAKKKSKFATLLDNMGKQFDFIAIAIDRAATATEKFANMINDYVKPEVKQSALWNQYKSTGKEISVNQQAASKYKSEASSFASKAIKTVPKTKNSSKKKNQKRLRTYFERVRNGSMNINTIKNDNMRSAVESYQNLYEKYLQANSAAQQLKNTQRDLFNQWLNMPTEKAQKAIENLQNSYDTLSNRSSAASTGESGVARLVQTSNDRLSEAQSNVSSAKSTQSRASSANKTAQKKVSKATKSQKSKAKSVTKAVSKSGLSKKKKASLNKSIKAGKTISTKGLKGSAKKKATAYNKAVKSTKSAKSSAAKTSANLSNANSALYDAQVYLKNVQDSQAIASNYAGQPAYTYQNDVLDSQVKNKKKQYENSQTAVREASKNQAKYQKERENAQANKNKADSAVKTKGNNILKTKRAKKLSNSQKNAIKSGKEVSLKGIKDKTLLKQLKAYNEQVKKAKDASNKLAQAKQNEADATNALATANKNANDAAADWAAEQTNAAVQSQANIKAYYDAKANMEATNSSNASSAAKLKQSKGQDLDSADYQNQIDANERQAQIIDEEAAKMQENLNNKLNDGSIKYGSQEWMQMQNEINACKGSADDLRASNEELKNSMRDDIYYRGFERAIKAAQNLQNSLTTISSLIDEDAMFDDDGNLTDYGTAAIATNIANVRSEKEELNQLMQERAKMAEHRDEYSDTEWADAIQKSDQDIADAVKSIKSAEDSVTTILKNNAKQKLDAINKTIDAYKTSLSTEKSYYEYDKQLKSSNKEIQILESKRKALEGVNTAEAKAQKARLDAEIQEKKDARDDTVKDHIYNLQIDGLDKLSTQLNDDYEKYCKELSSSVDKIEETFTSLSGTISSEGAKIDSTITTILGHYGVKPSDLGLTDSKVTGYAKGGLVKSVHKNGDDGLASLAVGEEVATVDVVNLANKVRQDKVLNALANGHMLNGMTMDGIGTTEINVNFGEAIGAINVPSGVSDEELQRIVNESYKYTSQKVTRDMAKIVGRKRPV